MQSSVWSRQQHQQNSEQPGGGGGGVSYSVFPVDNYDIIYKRWEDDIIWDSEVRG